MPQSVNSFELLDSFSVFQDPDSFNSSVSLLIGSPSSGEQHLKDSKLDLFNSLKVDSQAVENVLSSKRQKVSKDNKDDDDLFATYVDLECDVQKEPLTPPDGIILTPVTINRNIPIDTKDKTVTIQDSTCLVATKEPNIVKGFLQEINNFQFNSDAFVTLNKTAIDNDFSEFALDNIEITEDTQLHDPFDELLLAMLDTNNNVSNTVFKVAVPGAGDIIPSTPTFAASRSPTRSTMSTPRSTSSTPKRICPGPLPLFESAIQDKPHNHVPSLGSFRVRNNIQIEDLANCSCDGLADSQFTLNKKYKVGNAYFPEILKKEPDSRGNSGCCPYCIPTQGDIDNGYINLFKSLNSSHYLHHLCKSHGVLSNGTFIPDPVNLIWAEDGRNEVEAVNCPDCGVLLKLLTFDADDPGRNRLMEYLRHYELVHIKGKGQKMSPK